VEVDDNFDAIAPSPSHSLLEVGQLAGDVGFTGANLKGPISDRDADMVQSNSG
jgi:hypothetical protein